MKDELKRMLGSWGTYLAVIPFIVLLIYGAVAVFSAVKGAVANSVGSWLLSKFLVFVVSAVVLVGVSALITGFER